MIVSTEESYFDFNGGDLLSFVCDQINHKAFRVLLDLITCNEQHIRSKNVFFLFLKQIKNILIFSFHANYQILESLQRFLQCYELNFNTF